VNHQTITYQELGVVHFVTVPSHRNKGYASLLADAMYQDIVKPLLAVFSDNNNHSDIQTYVVATGRAAPLMERTEISSLNLIKQFYSDASFEEKVVNYLNNIKD
jgi:hypothetical protein